MPARKEHLPSPSAIPPDGPGAERRHDEIARSSRPDFRRDRDRLFHAKAFLQLDRKTELFTTADAEGPSRLLYAMRGASTARALAELLHLNEEVAEAAALGRTLGLPAFGRAGIAALATGLKDHGGFTPAAQSLHVADELEAKYPEFNGLNLSRAVREAIHPATSLEAQAAAWAMRITRACLDLECGIDAGLLSEESLARFPLWREIAEPTERHYAKLEPVRRRHYHFRNLISLLVDRAVAASASGGMERIGPDVATSTAFAELETWIEAGVRRAPALEALYRDRAACIADLFAIYVHRPHLLGEAALVRLKKEGVHHAVADFLCHQGDRDLLRLRRELVGEKETAQGRATKQAELL